MRKIFLSLMALSLSASASTFKECDKNGDNKLSSEEVQQCLNNDLQENFKTIDKNENGFLEKEELKNNR